MGNTIYRTMIGNYSNKLDDKGRLTIPSKFRNELGELVVISYGFDNTLEIRTSKAFEEWSNSLVEKGNLSSNARNISRIILGNSFEINLDKSGRVLLPKQLIEIVKLSKEVTLIGVGNKIEVHSTNTWDNFTSDSEQMTKTLEQMAEDLSKEK